jgi:F420-dependent oxidoreductase-like protein
MTTPVRLRFGIKTAQQHTTYEEMLRIWREADALPIFEHAWLFDHFMPLGSRPTGPCLEGWTLLAALAAQTQRLRVGVMVTGNTYRHPAVLANMAATVDVITHGRLEFGIGAAWNEREHASYGIPFYPDAERIRRLGEACEVIRRLWTQSVVDFDGQYYQLTEARCEPKPVQQPHPPVVIGGGGEQLTLRVVAQYADIWDCMTDSPEEYRHKSMVLDSHCAAIGRDPATIERSKHVFVDPTDLPAARNEMRPFIEAGATHLILHVSAPYPVSIVQRLAEEVAEPLRTEYASS